MGLSGILEIDETHKYGIVAPPEPGTYTVIPIKSFETLDELREQYPAWRDEFLKDRVPVLPVEFSDNEFTCKVLTDLCKARE